MRSAPVVLTSSWRVGRAAAALAIGLLIAAAAVVPPARPLPVDLCVLHNLTGLPCLTCGLTRAVCLLLQGWWGESVRMHPAAAPALALACLVAVSLGLEAARGRTAGRPLLRRLIMLLAGAGALLAVVHWIARAFA